MTPSDFADRRQFSRISMDGDAVFHCGPENWPARLIDISLKGALISLPDGWHSGATQSCLLEILLGEDVTIRMAGDIAHAGGAGIGFRCRHIDVESISHLKRLVELNLGDVALLERELSELA